MGVPQRAAMKALNQGGGVHRVILSRFNDSPDGYARRVPTPVIPTHPDPLRVCFVSMHTSPASPPGAGDAGGMNVVELAQALALARGGHQVEMVTRRHSPEDPDHCELAPGVTLHHLDAGPATPLPKSAIDEHIDQFGAGLAELGPFDIYHSHHWMSGLAALPVARAAGVRHVQSFHSVAAPSGSSLEAGEPPESARRVPGEAIVATASDAVGAISAAEARTVIERCGADPARVHIISPGVDHELFRPARDGEVGWTPAGGVGRNGFIAFAGRLQPLKGADLAIAALAGLDPAIRPRLVVAGEASQDFADYPDQLRRAVAEFEVHDDVDFCGPLPRQELAQMLRSARLVLVPSHSETFGLIALEAQSSGVPVVAACAGGLREAVAHAETGYLVDARDPAAWSRVLTELLADPDTLTRLGTVARVHALRFDWLWSARRLAACYRKVLAP